MIITDKAQIKIAELRESNNLRLSESDELECYELIESDLKLPADATFTRSSVAYLSDGTQVAANVPRFEQGKFGKAVMMEEGTTNLLTANQSDVETDTSGFGYNLCTLSRDTSLSWHGSACLKVTINNGAVSSGLYVTTANASVIAGENVTASAYVRKGQGDYSVRITIEWKNSSGQIIDYVKGVRTPLTEHWQRLTVTGTAPAGTDRVTITIYTDTTGVAGDYFYVDGWQVEKKAYPTSWVPGGTTRFRETLTIPTAGVLNPQEGTIEFWVKPLVVANYNNFFHMQTSNGRFLLFFGTNFYSAIFDYGATNSGVKSSANTITTNNWYHIVLRWSATTGKQALFVNGVKYEQDLPNGVATSFPATVNIVNTYSAYIDDLRISNRARSDEEILTAYQSEQPLPVDEWTTYKLDFDDKVRITTQGQIICNELIEI